MKFQHHVSWTLYRQPGAVESLYRQPGAVESLYRQPGAVESLYRQPGAVESLRDREEVRYSDYEEARLRDYVMN